MANPQYGSNSYDAKIDDIATNGISAGSAVADAGAIAAYSAVTNMTASVTKAEGEAVSAALAGLRAEVADLTTTVNSLLASLRAKSFINT